MMRGLGVLLLLALGGCASPGYRDQSVAIASMAVFDPARFAGIWYEVARFPVPFLDGCSQAQAVYGLREDGGISVRNSCAATDELAVRRGLAVVNGPGRMAINFEGAPAMSDFWILWIDEGYRTAVVGRPSGNGGWIMNRDRSIPGDRLQAAREVLEFNGYDLSRLEIVGPGEGQ